MNNLDRNQYPELNLILWDHAARYVSPEMAFRTYEQRWRFVEENRLTEPERRLIEQLSARFGEMLIA